LKGKFVSCKTWSLEVLLEIYLIKITSPVSGKEFTKTVKGNSRGAKNTKEFGRYIIKRKFVYV
jgi:hypothetical protein